ncbi:MAG: TetR/AcrR family transcriptional regulator [Chitinophagia bacterium]|nr:TetR/AcrR family transcriptional regulator [Chitinophagia bacterium]
MEYNQKQLTIINAAEALFAEQGFVGTSVRDIAQKADVNIAMISYYFGSKEKLMEAVFQLKSEKIKLKVDSLLADDSLFPIQKVHALIDDYLARFCKHQIFHRIILREKLAENETSIGTLLMEMRLKNLEAITKLIQQGQEEGSFKASIDIPLAMLTMVGVLNQMLTSIPFYQKVHHLEHLTEDELSGHVQQVFSDHLKNLFNKILLK